MPKSKEALEQRTHERWQTVEFASRFLNDVEKRFSIRQLNFLGVVWAIEHFNYYLYGRAFQIITDDRTFFSFLGEK